MILGPLGTAAWVWSLSSNSKRHNLCVQKILCQLTGIAVGSRQISQPRAVTTSLELESLILTSSTWETVSILGNNQPNWHELEFRLQSLAKLDGNGPALGRLTAQFPWASPTHPLIRFLSKWLQDPILSKRRQHGGLAGQARPSVVCVTAA